MKDETAAFGDLLHLSSVSDIALDEPNLTFDPVEVLLMAGKEIVEHDDLVAAFDELRGDVGANEPGSTCDEYTHVSPPP